MVQAVLIYCLGATCAPIDMGLWFFEAPKKACSSEASLAFIAMETMARNGKLGNVSKLTEKSASYVTCLK
jgi:hypothetical protein